MNDEMTITVIAAGFDDNEDPSLGALASPEDDVISIENPLLSDLDLGGAPAPARPTSSNQDDDLEAIFKMLGN